MDGPVDTSGGQPIPIGRATCLGCMPRILPGSKHDCVGDKIHDAGVLWWCYCREPVSYDDGQTLRQTIVRAYRIKG
ncbi:hypothetical protein [Micromonospora sp. NPDC048898]|uniref:hypothetical protein n=1 Tax=Micromonospora sp. NPDC048898 TaxID=3364260 RepID=UPI00371C5851